MKPSVIVCGHKNPDNDSICSAVGYAYLKNAIAKRDGVKTDKYQAYTLGALPPESEWILKKNNIDAPRPLTHVHLRVKDVMTENPISISKNATMLEAGRLLRKHNIRSLVVLDDDGKFLGLISTRAIAERYISATDELAEGDPASSMAVASSLIDSLTQKVEELMATNVLVLEADGLMNEAAVDLVESELREGIVLDTTGRPLGIVTRSDVAAAPKRKVILVDHNETRQAAPGLEESDVLEIIDHHRIADVSTANPIRFLNLPWGSTATIVTYEFRREGIEVPQSIAEVLLSAIMTDTVILKSPTTTDIDRDQVDYLCGVIGCDPVEFGLEVFRARGGDEGMPIKSFVESDSKEFQVGDSTVLIAQHETVDLKAAMTREAEIREHMQKILSAKGYGFVLLMITDIVAEGSQFILEGNPKAVEHAFDIKVNPNGGNWMPSILSRKKQVITKLL